MSTFVPSTIVCRCGEHYVADVANGLHISLRPDVRQQILDGTFHRFHCPNCGVTTQVESLLSFTDFPKRQWFTIAPTTGLPWRRQYLEIAEQGFESTIVRNAPEFVVEWGREMTRRLMFGLASLREKLVTLDAGLDDRVIELLKIQLLRDLRGTFSPNDYFHLVEVRDDELRFEKLHPDGIVRVLPISRALYVDLAAHPEIENMIGQAFPDGLVFDFRAILAPHAAGEPPPASL
ncbi:MAG TPA: CpXC domain-containing protein [Kofleriaceae bacterium]|nr:CpXC domain-containing protein [Kofleriaceae bacterium]